MRAKTILLSLAALVFLAAGYRFASHGIAGHDNKCIAFGVVAFALAALLLWLAFRIRMPKRGV
jgi:hypothetical protein